MKTKEGLCSKITLSIFFLLVLCRTAGAQDSQKATLTAADAGTCSATSTACLVIDIPSGSGGATFNIGANASANTVQFEATADYGATWVALNVVPSNATTAVTSTTSTGAWQANVAGYRKARIRCSTFVAGTIAAYINLSTASARSNGGGGSVTHTAGNLTAFHLMLGNGLADSTVDSACLTNGTGALSGCTTIKATSSIQAVGAAAQAMNLYTSGSCDAISACTGQSWGFQAPASLVSSLTYTGNLTDGSGNSAFVTDGLQHLSTVQLPQYIAGAGLVNVMTATYVPAFSAYAAGEEFDVLPNLANTTTNPTLNVNGLGAATVTKCGTAVLAAGDYSTTAVAKFIYDGTRMQLQNPQAAACGGASGALVQVPATTAANTIAPTVNSVVGLTVLGTTGTGTDLIRVCSNSAGACGSKYFDLNSTGNPEFSQAGITMDTNNFTDTWRSNDSGSRIHDFTDSSGVLETSLCQNVTPVTLPGTSTTADQNLMACTINAKALNAAGRAIRVRAKDLYTTAAGNLSTITRKLLLCSVSGCASGNITTLIAITSSAQVGTITNDPIMVNCIFTTQTAGAASRFEASGDMLIDLSSAVTAAASDFLDTNTTTKAGSPSDIDTSAQMFLQSTISFSIANAGNLATERQLTVEIIN